MTDISLAFVFAVLLASFFMGLGATSIFKHPSLRRALIAITASMRRSWRKHIRFNIGYRPREQLALNERGATCGPDSRDARNLRPDFAALEAARGFCALLSPNRRKDIIGVYLFGSRARGDHEDTSDVDIAILFSGQHNIGVSMYLRTVIVGCISLFTHGLYLQVRMLRPGSKVTAALLPHIRHDGILVWDTKMSSISRQ